MDSIALSNIDMIWALQTSYGGADSQATHNELCILQITVLRLCLTHTFRLKAQRNWGENNVFQFHLVKKIVNSVFK